MRVDVARRHARDARAAAASAASAAVARAVVALEGALQLDPEARRARRRRSSRRSVGSSRTPRARAAAQADEPLGVLLAASSSGDRRRAERRAAPGAVARVRVRAREQPAQVAPARGVLDQQREVAHAVRAGARRSARSISAPWIARRPERLRRLRELHRARDRVVVGQRQRRVAQLDAPRPTSSSGSDAPSRNEKAEWQWSST